MDYTVRHVTQFRYSAPITESVMEVRMQPRREGFQHCLSFELQTVPRARVMASRDYLGNIVHHFDIPGKHSELTLTAQALVTIGAQPPLQPLDGSSWDEIDRLVAEGDYAEMIVPSTFARPSPLLRELATKLKVIRRDDPLSLLREIMERVHNTLAYTPNSTRVDSPIDDALRLRQGVCQDYTHIMIGLVRSLDIPCRYVSGYLYRRGTDKEHVGADATHAWAEALLPQMGWVGFDPTNNLLVEDRHIRVAVGRDYGDVPPTRGVFKGQATSELGVAVRVAIAGEEHVDDELTLVMQKGPAREQPGEQPLQQQQTTESQDPIRIRMSDDERSRNNERPS